MADSSFLVGRLLLALPSIGDQRFSRATIALCTHDADGAMGIGIGAIVADVTVGDIFDSLEIEASHCRDAPVRFGGPVEMQRGFVIHQPGWSCGEVLDVAGRWALSGSREALAAIGAGDGPERWLLALGYAGWGPGQIEAEIASSAWHVGEFDRDRFYDDRIDHWAAAFAAQGIDPTRIVSEGGSA